MSSSATRRRRRSSRCQEVGAVVLRALARGDSTEDAAARRGISPASRSTSPTSWPRWSPPTHVRRGHPSSPLDRPDLATLGALLPQLRHLDPVRGLVRLQRRRADRAPGAATEMFQDYMFLLMVAWRRSTRSACSRSSGTRAGTGCRTRAAGVPARFRISQRGMFLVAETDLTLLLTLPRAAATPRCWPARRSTCWSWPCRWPRSGSTRTARRRADTPARLLQAVVLIQVIGLVWQCAVFLAQRPVRGARLRAALREPLPDQLADV